MKGFLTRSYVLSFCFFFILLNQGFLSTTVAGTRNDIVVQLYSDPGLDGTISDLGLLLPSDTELRVGDEVTTNDTYRAFISFDISSIPASTLITSATLKVTQTLETGSPYVNLGDVIVDVLNYGPTLEALDYDVVPTEANIGTLSFDNTAESKTLPVPYYVQEQVSAGNTRIQFRLRHQTATDNNGLDDYSNWFSGDNSVDKPELLITYNDSVSTIGGGSVENEHLPFENADRYSYTQTIYMAADIGSTDEKINRIAYYYNGNSAWSSDITIYMGQTTDVALTDWVPIEELVQVYQGSFSVDATEGWKQILLDTPFAFDNNGTNNLVVAFDENSSNTGNDGDDFYCTLSPTRGNVSIYYSHSLINADPVSPPASGMSNSQYFANINLFFEDRSPTGEIVTHPSSVDFGNVLVNSSSTPMYFSVSNSGGSALDIDSVVLGGTNADQFTINDPNAGTYPLSLDYGDFVQFNVTYSPTVVGTHVATVTVSDSKKRATHTIPLSGQAITAVPFFDRYGASLFVILILGTAILLLVRMKSEKYSS